MQIIPLKGGSLSSTNHHKDNNFEFVRKTINLSSSREYGYVRWYSQLKKLQRFTTMWPNLVPKVLSVGVENGNAYFDLEFLQGYTDIKTIFSRDHISDNLILKINNSLWQAFNKIHANKLIANKGATFLYFQEEIFQKILDARKNEGFNNFLKHNSYFYNGQKVPNIVNELHVLEKYFSSIDLEYENFIHGNPTLENTMYSIDEDKIKFIDLYEESIIDSKFLDYSQVLQCSRSFYGFINDREVNINGNSVFYNQVVPKNYLKFTECFLNNINKKDLTFIDILEASQFIRMLPFKCYAGEIDKAKYFFVHACYLFNKIFK